MNWQAKLGTVALTFFLWLALRSPGEESRADTDRLAARQLTHPEAHRQLLQAEAARHLADGPLPLFCAALGLAALACGPEVARRFRTEPAPTEEN